MASNEGRKEWSVGVGTLHSGAPKEDVMQHEALGRGSARQKHKIIVMNTNTLVILIQYQSCLSGFVHHCYVSTNLIELSNTIASMLSNRVVRHRITESQRHPHQSFPLCQDTDPGAEDGLTPVRVL